MKKKNLFIFLNWIVITLICFLIFDKYYLNKKINKLKNSSNLIYKLLPQINTLHHVREFSFLENESLDSLILKKRGPKSFNKQILFQGDSWAEQNILYKNSSDYLNKYSTKNSISIIDSGTSSYSFSLMSSQLKYLKDYYKINPNVIISIVDHTDLADEICRYKNRIVYRNNYIKEIKPEPDNSSEIYNYNLEFQKKINEIFTSEKNIYVKKALIIFETIKFQIKNLKKNKKKCNLENIVKTLKIDNSDFNKNLLYFRKITNLYIDEVFKENKNIQLVLVIHPWILHKETNNFYFSNFFKEIISKRKEKRNIHLLDFQPIYPNLYLQNNLRFDEIHVQNDITSHLTPKSQLIFLKYILSFQENLF